MDIKNQKGFIPVVIILIVLVAIAGAYYFGTLKNKITLVVPTSTPVTSTQPSSGPIVKPTADPTADWKTYTNSSSGFSFKYPSGWVDMTTQETIKQGNREFQIKTTNNEYVLGVVFETPADSQNDTNTRKSLDLKNGKSLLVTYVQCQGPGCGFGTKDVTTFDQILSTFRFTR